MTIELLYTSAAQGLKQGSRGFCTVVSTAGLPINLAQRLEALSGYRHLYQPGDARADENPVCHSHIRLAVGGKTLSILSRVSAYGVDYSQRTNKIAHHVVFDGPVPGCGPASVLLEPGIMRTRWDGECKTLPSGPSVPPLSLKPAPCNGWQRITGDAGWAGVVANTWLQPTGKPVWIVFSESQSGSLLGLMQEAIAILPEAKRWQATFSTYCTNLPPDVDCRVRCVMAGSEEARMSIARGTVLDLTKPMGAVTNGDATEAAINGKTIGETKFQASAFSDTAFQPAGSNNNDGDSLLIGASDNEYYLQNAIPAALPIPFAKTYRSSRIESIPAKSEIRSFRGWMVVAISIGLAVTLSLVGTIAFFLSNPIAVTADKSGTDASDSKEEQKPLGSGGLPAKIADEQIDQADELKQKNEIESKANPKLTFSQKVSEIDEGEPVHQSILVGEFSVDLGDVNAVELVEGKNFFEISQGKLFLIKNPMGYSIEHGKSLNAKICLAEQSEEIKIAIKQLNLEKLQFKLTDGEKNSAKSSVKVGEKVFASVNVSNQSKLRGLQFKWKGLNLLGDWVDCSSGMEYTVGTRFLRVNCTMSHLVPASSAQVVIKSEDLLIVHEGVGRLCLDDVVAEKGDAPLLHLELPIGDLPQLGDKQSYRVAVKKTKGNLIEKNRSVSVPFQLSLGAQGDKTQGYALPSTLAKCSDVDSWLLSVRSEWIAFANKKKSVLDAIKGKSVLSDALRRFISKTEPSDFDGFNDFMSESGKFGEWFRELDDFDKLRAGLAKHQDRERNKSSLPVWEKILEELASGGGSHPELDKWEMKEKNEFPTLRDELGRLIRLRKKFGLDVLYNEAIPAPLLGLLEKKFRTARVPKDNSLIDFFVKDCRGRQIPMLFQELRDLGLDFQRVSQDLSKIEVEIAAEAPVSIQLVTSSEINPVVKDLAEMPFLFKLEIVNSKMERVKSKNGASKTPPSFKVLPPPSDSPEPA